MAKETKPKLLGSIQRDVLKREEEEKRQAESFHFLDTDGSVLFTCPQHRVMNGLHYDAVDTYKKMKAKRSRELTPITAQLVEMQVTASTEEEKKAATRFTLQQREKLEAENDDVTRLNRMEEYEIFQLSLDTRGLTVAHRNKVEALFDENGNLTRFYLLQDVEAIREFGQRFRQRVGI